MHQYDKNMTTTIDDMTMTMGDDGKDSLLLFNAIESNSSKNKMQGAALRARANSDRMNRSVSPKYFENISGLLLFNNEE